MVHVTAVKAFVDSAGSWIDTDDNADVVNVLVTTGQLVPTLGKLLLFKLDGAFKATCEYSCLCTCMATSFSAWIINLLCLRAFFSVDLTAVSVFVWPSQTYRHAQCMLNSRMMHRSPLLF